MTKNQNDHGNRQSDIKTHQELTQDGNENEETNPKSTKSNQQDSQQRNRQHQESTSTKGETNTIVKGKKEEKITDTTTSVKTGKQKSKRGHL